MLWRVSRPLRSPSKPPGFILPCQPTLAERSPSGPDWAHEIKLDGYRMIARKDGEQVRLEKNIMQIFGWFKALAVSVLLTLWMGAAAARPNAALPRQASSSWKQQFAEEARGKVGGAAIAALMSTHYAPATISADRGQRSFHLSLDQFLAKRGGSAIAARGRSLKQSHAALFASIEQRYGVPPGPLLAIWGMETGFGAVHGNQNMLSAVATLAYDCRRSEYFTDQLYAALKLVDAGVFSAATRGSMHGEVGQWW